MKLIWKVLIIVVIWIFVSLISYETYKSTQQKNQLIQDMEDSTKWTLVPKGATITQSAHEATQKSRSHQYGKSTDWYRTEHTTVDTTYHPIIIYKYQVDGRDYTGSTVSPDGRFSFGDLQGVILYLNQYPVGGKVDIFYQIGNHSHSYLTKGHTGSSLWPLIIIAIIGVVVTSAFALKV